MQDATAVVGSQSDNALTEETFEAIGGFHLLKPLNVSKKKMRAIIEKTFQFVMTHCQKRVGMSAQEVIQATRLAVCGIVSRNIEKLRQDFKETLRKEANSLYDSFSERDGRKLCMRLKAFIKRLSRSTSSPYYIPA